MEATNKRQIGSVPFKVVVYDSEPQESKDGEYYFIMISGLLIGMIFPYWMRGEKYKIEYASLHTFDVGIVKEGLTWLDGENGALNTVELPNIKLNVSREYSKVDKIKLIHFVPFVIGK